MSKAKQYVEVSIEVGLDATNLSGYTVVGDYRRNDNRYLTLRRPEQSISSRKLRKVNAKPKTADAVPAHAV